MSIWSADGWFGEATRSASPNFGMRPSGIPVSLVVVHNISLPPDEFGGPWVEDFFLNRLNVAVHPYFQTISEVQVSSHFFIRRDGQTIQFVSCDDRAWHAGASSWRGQENCNDYSVGIELEGADALPYTEAQYAALWMLIDALRRRYPIEAIAGHCHIAPLRKSDPGPAFDWSAVRQKYPDLDLPAEVLA